MRFWMPRIDRGCALQGPSAPGRPFRIGRRPDPQAIHQVSLLNSSEGPRVHPADGRMVGGRFMADCDVSVHAGVRYSSDGIVGIKLDGVSGIFPLRRFR